jgi:hypothetical protein
MGDVAVAGETISAAFEDSFGHDQIPNAFNNALGGKSSGAHRKPKNIQIQQKTKLP